MKLSPVLAGLIALGADPDTAARATSPCRYCGDHHSALDLCTPKQRERSHGMSRRSFLFLSAAGVVGAMLPLPSFARTPAVVETFDLAALNAVVQSEIMPGIQDMFFTSSPMLAYLREKIAGEGIPIDLTRGVTIHD